jgi:DNA-binding winged helix-turn-helix (wHTH) protein/Tfp pilus assembly protein PilF
MYAFGPFELDSDQLLLSVDGAPLALGPKVVETLLALIEHPGEVLSKSALLDRVWPEGYVEEANLAQNIYVLRKALRAHWENDAILTAPRRGYRFSGEVSSIRRAPSVPAVVATFSTWWRHRASVAAVLAASLVLALAAVAATTLARGPTAVAQTQPLSQKGARLFAIGRYYWNQRTTAGVQKSLMYFAQVVDTDPHAARGYAALADANAIMGDYHYGALPVRVYFQRARAYAQKALVLDANSADAYAVLGMLETESMNAKALSRGLAELRRAIALDPAYGPGHQWYGIALLNQGRVHEAMRELQTAANLDPLSVSTTAWLSSAAYLDRQYDEAIAYAHQTLDLSPSRIEVWQELGLAYEARGDYVRAIASFETLAAKCPKCASEAAALLAHAYAMNHDLVRAHAEFARARSDRKNVSLEDLAVAQAAIGDRNGALALLRSASGDYSRKLIALDPRLDAFRDDARFRSFIQKPA